MVETKKPRGSSVEEFSIIKAAAWAWYERESKFKNCKPTREYDFTTTRRDPKPSRFKLEATKKAQEEIERQTQCFGSILSLDHADNSLLDMYEIQRISRELDYYIESSSAAQYHHCQSVDDTCGRRRIVPSSSESDKSGTKGKRKSKKTNGGFWLRHGVVCGSSRDDVVENIVGLVVGGRQPEKHIPVVRVANFQRQATHV